MIRRLFFTLLTAFSLSGFAQVTSFIGIDTGTASYSIPDTAYMTQIITYDVTLRNFGTDTISDDVTVFVAVDIDTTGGINWILVDSASFTFPAFVPGDTQSVTVPGDIDSGIFKIGVNPVVIWPKANSASTYDSLFEFIFVETFTGIDDPGNLKGFIMYPNPSKDFLFFNSLTQEHPYKKIKIYDMEGKLVVETPFTAKVDVSLLRPGLYTVAVETSAGEPRKLKFLKE